MTLEDPQRFNALLKAWESRPPAPARLEDIENLLIREYSAYEIPTTVIPWDDYVLDDEVRENEIAKLYTITDPKSLARAFDEYDLAMWAGEGDAAQRDAWLEEDRRFLFEEPDLVGFRLLHIEQGRGERVSVLLEAREEVATGFRVYNSAGNLAAVLLGRIGPVSFPESVEVGNVDDRDFRIYLESVHRQGLL